MNIRSELEQKIRTALTDGGTTDEMTARVMALFWSVEEDIDRQEVTAMADSHEQVLWTRSAVAKCAMESGRYTGAAKPTDPWVRRGIVPCYD